MCINHWIYLVFQNICTKLTVKQKSINQSIIYTLNTFRRFQSASIYAFNFTSLTCAFIYNIRAHIQLFNYHHVVTNNVIRYLWVISHFQCLKCYLHKQNGVWGSSTTRVYIYSQVSNLSRSLSISLYVYIYIYIYTYIHTYIHSIDFWNVNTKL